MSTDLKYDLAIAECNSLRRQLKDAYNKCTAIYEALIVLDDYSTNERNILESLVFDLKQTLENELEKNMELSMKKIHSEFNEKFLQQELNDKNHDLNKIMRKYQRIYINQQQEKFIQDNLVKIRMKK